MLSVAENFAILCFIYVKPKPNFHKLVLRGFDQKPSSLSPPHDLLCMHVTMSGSTLLVELCVNIVIDMTHAAFFVCAKFKVIPQKKS